MGQPRQGTLRVSGSMEVGRDQARDTQSLKAFFFFFLNRPKGNRPALMGQAVGSGAARKAKTAAEQENTLPKNPVHKNPLLLQLPRIHFRMTHGRSTGPTPISERDLTPYAIGEGLEPKCLSQRLEPKWLEPKGLRRSDKERTIAGNNACRLPTSIA